MSRAAFHPSIPRELGTQERAVSDLFEQAGGVKRVMVDLDVSKSTAYAMTERNSSQPITLAQAAALTRPGATAVAEWFAQLAGGVFVPVTPDVGDVPALCADEMRANGDAIASIVEAMSDGKITEQERRQALEKLRRVLRAVLALEGALSTDLRKPAG